MGTRSTSAISVMVGVPGIIRVAIIASALVGGPLGCGDGASDTPPEPAPPNPTEGDPAENDPAGNDATEGDAAEDHSIYDDPDIDFGLRRGDRTFRSDILIFNKCSTPHEVTIEIGKNTWLKVSGKSTKKLKAKQEGVFPVLIDPTKAGPGTHKVEIELGCESCGDACTAASTVAKTARITVPAANTFGADPADKNLHGLVNGKPVDSAEWLVTVVKDIKKSTFGTTSRGKKIISELEQHYLEGNLSDITLVPTVDKILGNGRYSQDTPAVDGENPRPGNAVYVREQTVAFIWMEEIYIGIDQSTAGITEARKHPDDYYVFTHGGKMSVLKRDDIVHGIIHEGLHAVQEGTYNVGGRACTEEEQDGFKAGNDAAKAMGLPPSTTSVAGPGYGSKSNPAYTPLSMKLEELPGPETLEPDTSFEFTANCSRLDSALCKRARTWHLDGAEETVAWKSPELGGPYSVFDGVWDVEAPGNPFIDEILINIDTTGGILSHYDPNSAAPIKSRGIWRYIGETQLRPFTPYLEMGTGGTLEASMGQFAFCNCVPIKMSVTRGAGGDTMVGTWKYEEKSGSVVWKRRPPIEISRIEFASAKKEPDGTYVRDAYDYGERLGRIERTHPISCGYGEMRGNCDGLWVTVEGRNFAGAHTVWIDPATHIEINKARWVCRDGRRIPVYWHDCGEGERIGDAVTGIDFRILFRKGMRPGPHRIWVDFEPIDFEVFLGGHPDNDKNLSCPWDDWEDAYAEIPSIEIGGAGKLVYGPARKVEEALEVASKLTDQELDKILRETLAAKGPTLEAPTATRLAYEAPKNALQPAPIRTGNILARSRLMRFLGMSLAFDAATANAMYPYMGNQFGLGARYRVHCMEQWEMWQALDYDVPDPPSPQEVIVRAMATALENNLILESNEIRRRFPDSFDVEGRLRARNGCTVKSKPLENFPEGARPPWLIYQTGVTGQPSEYTVTSPSGKTKEFDGLRFAFNRLGESTILYGIEAKGNIDPARGQSLVRWVQQAWDQREIANECGFALIWVVGRETLCNRFADQEEYRRLIPAHHILYWPHDDLPPPIFESLIGRARFCY